MMKALVITFFMLMISFPSVSDEFQLGKDINQLIRLQTVDPLAENRVPTGSPPFSGKKAAKSINTVDKGVKSEQVKNKKMILSN